MQTIVITGASTGIGRAAAEYLAERGFRVFAGVRKIEDGQPLVEANQNILPILLDVTNPEQVSAAVEIVRKALGGQKLAGLVNNAGVADIAPLAVQDLVRFESHFEVNVFGLLRATQAFVPLLGMDTGLKGAPGRIVNITSVSGCVALPFFGAYTATKYAVESITDTLRRELVIFGIDAIAVGPGSVKTPIWDKAGETNKALPYADTAWGTHVEKFSDYMLEAGRVGLDPEEIAKVIEKALTEVSPRARYAPVRNKFRNFIMPTFLPKRVFDRALWKSFKLEMPAEE